MISCFHVTLFVIYKRANLTYWSPFIKELVLVSKGGCFFQTKLKSCSIFCLVSPSRGAHQWNKLRETCRMKYLYDAINQYISMEQSTLWNKKHMLLEIYFMKLINSVAWGNVVQLQCCWNVFCRFERKGYNYLREIYFLSALGCKYVAWNIIMKSVSRNMFHRCALCLKFQICRNAYNVYLIWFTKWEEFKSNFLRSISNSQLATGSESVLRRRVGDELNTEASSSSQQLLL